MIYCRRSHESQDTEPREILNFHLVPADPADANAIIIPPTSSITSISIIEDPNDGALDWLNIIYSYGYFMITVSTLLPPEVQISPLSSVTTVMEGNNATYCLGVSFGSLQREIRVKVKSIAGISSTGDMKLHKTTLYCLDVA